MIVPTSLVDLGFKTQVRRYNRISSIHEAKLFTLSLKLCFLSYTLNLRAAHVDLVAGPGPLVVVGLFISWVVTCPTP